LKSRLNQALRELSENLELYTANLAYGWSDEVKSNMAWQVVCSSDWHII